jgi:methylmalonyl-CoA/ethylmalonyl-CoA epimerase
MEFLPAAGALSSALGHPVVVGQIGFVVPDCDAAVKAATEVFGLGPFNTYDVDGADMAATFRGEAVPWKIRVAVNGGTPQVEFIESTGGPNIYEEATAAGRAGLHHLGFYIETSDGMDDVDAAMAEQGFANIQGGQTDGARFAYYDTEERLGFISEIIWLAPGSPFGVKWGDVVDD